MVPADAPIDAVGGDVGLELLVDVKTVFLSEDVDLGAREFFPFPDSGVERLILVAANDLRADLDARKRSGLIGGRMRDCMP